MVIGNELDRNHLWSEFERRKSPLSTAANYFELSYTCYKNYGLKKLLKLLTSKGVKAYLALDMPLIRRLLCLENHS